MAMFNHGTLVRAIRLSLPRPHVNGSSKQKERAPRPAAQSFRAHGASIHPPRAVRAVFRIGATFLATPSWPRPLLYRLLHHAIVIQIEGSSYRLRQHADLVPDHIRSNATAQSSTAPIKHRGRPPKTGGPDRSNG